MTARAHPYAVAWLLTASLLLRNRWEHLLEVVLDRSRSFDYSALYDFL